MMNMNRYTEINRGRIYIEPPVVPDYARMEHLENIVPLSTLWRMKRFQKKKYRS